LANRSNNNIPVVPQARQGLEQFKYEVAKELGIAIPADGQKYHYFIVNLIKAQMTRSRVIFLKVFLSRVTKSLYNFGSLLIHGSPIF
jgi:hypothetical protein